MKKVDAIFRPERLATLTNELEQHGFHGFTISDVRGHGRSPEAKGEWRGQTYELFVTHKLAIEIIVEEGEVDAVIAAIIRGTHTGALGDGLVTVTDLVAVYQISAGAPAAGTPAPPSSAQSGQTTSSS